MENKSLKEDDFGQGFKESILTLYKKQLWTDATLIIDLPKDRDNQEQEAKSIKAHKIILASRSPVFKAMFFGPNASKSDTVHIKESDEKSVEGFLLAIYGGTFEYSCEKAVGILKLAHCYLIQDIVETCCEMLQKHLNITNACLVLDNALFYDQKKLIEYACTYIDKNAEEVLNSEDFFRVSEDCLTYIICGDTFYAKETLIVAKTLQWAKRRYGKSNTSSDRSSLQNFLGKAFACLRWSSMSVQDIMESSLQNLFSLEEYKDIITQLDVNSTVTGACSSRQARKAVIEVISFSEDFDKKDGMYEGIYKKAEAETKFSVPKHARSIDICSIRLCEIKAVEMLPDHQYYRKQMEDFIPIGRRTLYLDQNFPLNLKGVFSCAEKHYNEEFIVDYPNKTDIAIPALTLTEDLSLYTLSISLQFVHAGQDVRICAKLCPKANRLALLSGIKIKHSSGREKQTIN